MSPGTIFQKKERKQKNNQYLINLVNLIILVENIKEIDLKELCLNEKRLGTLVFKEGFRYLKKLQDLFIEFDLFDYKGNLTVNEINNIDNYKNNFINYLNRIKEFNLNHSNPGPTHDQIQSEIRNFHDSVIGNIRSSLVYLRQEAQLKSKNERNLQEEQREAVKARKQYEELSKQLKNELELLQKQKGEIETAHGEVAAKYLAIQFNKQAKEYEGIAEKWLLRRNKLYWMLIGIIGVNFIFYFSFFVLNKIGKSFPPREIFTIEYGVVKLALLAVLSYGVGFASKNYNVNSHLAAINKHRSNVAQTLDDFLVTKPDRKSEMLRQGTEAMFKHISIGYIRREEQKDSGPIYEIINKFLPNKE